MHSSSSSLLLPDSPNDEDGQELAQYDEEIKEVGLLAVKLDEIIFAVSEHVYCQLSRKEEGERHVGKEEGVGQTSACRTHPRTSAAAS